MNYVLLLQAYNTIPNKVVKKERLSASDLLSVRKVIEHVYEKIVLQGLEEVASSSQQGSSVSSTMVPVLPSHRDKADTEQDNDTVAHDALAKVELLCNDHVLSPDLDLRTVKHFIWKQGSDLALSYRLIVSAK